MTKKRILLTGATGALGRALLVELTSSGHHVVCLARPQGSLSANERVRKIVREMKANPNRVSVVPGDVLMPRCGIRVQDKEIYRGRIDVIVHCAASISFDKKDEALTQATNVTGVQEMLALAEDLCVGNIAHVSTAYVAGNADAYTERNFYIGQQWRNPYEETKHVGEMLIKGWAGSDAYNRAFTIYRPSIIVGSVLNGWTPSFDAFYGYFRILHVLAESVRKRRRENRPLSPDISVDDSGRVTFPLVVDASMTSTLNLIPIDWLARMMAKHVTLAPVNAVVNLAHPKPQRVCDVITASLQCLRIDGVRIAPTRAHRAAAVATHSRLAATLQRSLDAVLGRYVPYTTHEARFFMRAASERLKGAFEPPPIVDAEALQQMIRFALRSEWGTVDDTLVPAE